jgi:hypothetical protein
LALDKLNTVSHSLLPIISFLPLSRMIYKVTINNELGGGGRRDGTSVILRLPVVFRETTIDFLFRREDDVVQQRGSRGTVEHDAVLY